MGRILRVDLNTGTLRSEPIQEDVAKKYLVEKAMRFIYFTNI
ncbi:MAG: hypothetical protein QXT26_08780 [Thermoproteota archaeon]